MLLEAGTSAYVQEYTRLPQPDVTPTTFDEIVLAERREQYDGRDALFCNPLRRGDAVEHRHLDVEDDEVGPQLLRELDRLLAVGGLTDDVVALFLEHLFEVEPDEGFVLGDENAPLARRRRGCRHGRRCYPPRSAGPFR